MFWGKRSYGGAKYDLTHLDPQIIEIPSHDGAPAIQMRLRFGSHVFTQKWTENDIEAYRVRDGGESRCFCPVRYEHSQHLPSILKIAVGGRVLFDPSKKLAMLGNPPRSPAIYCIFFKLTRVTRQPYELDCVVVSAHTNPYPRANKGMEFPHLARMVANGQPIPWPKKK